MKYVITSTRFGSPLLYSMKESGVAVYLSEGGFAIADLVEMAYGFNPYEKFFNDETIDWKKIWSTRQKQNFAFVLGYNGKDLNMQYQIPNREKFLKRFSKVLKFYELDHKTNPAFGVAFAETFDHTELSQLLELEFSEFFQ